MKIEMNQFFRKVCALIVTVAMTVGIVQGSMLAHAAEATAGKNMVPDLLTSVTLQKLKDGSYQEATEFNAKDSFKMIMHFRIPANTFGEKDTLEMYYQLPKSLTVQKEETGHVVDDQGNIFGEFTISEDGLITVTFNENFKINNTYTGKLNFLGKVSDTAGQDGDETINFGTKDSKITIHKNDKGHNTPDDDKNKSDSSITKKGTLSSDHKSVTYKVTVTTVNGTGDKVKLDDTIKQINNLTVSYDRSSFKIIKKDAHGQSTEVKFADSQLDIENDHKPNFTLKDLDALNAGESYELTYKMNLKEKEDNDGEELLVNGIKDKHSSTEIPISVSKKMSRKEGEVKGDKIRWIVYVNENERDLSSYVLNDKLPAGYHLTEKIKVEDETSGGEVKDLESNSNAGDQSIKIDFSKVSNDRKNHKFKITYWTNTKEPDVIGKTMTIENTAESTDDKGHNYNAHAKVDYQPYHLNKNLSKQTVKGDNLISNWDVDLKLSGHVFDYFIYKDTIQNGIKNNTDDLGPDSHYTTAKKLYDEISKSILLKQDINGESGRNVQWKTNYYQVGNDYEWTLSCSDKNGDPIANTNQTAHVKSFTLLIKPRNNKVKPTEFKLAYTTIGDISNMADKEKRSFYNNGELANYFVDGHEKSIVVPHQEKESSYTKEKAIEKLASFTGVRLSYQESLEGNLDDLKTSDHNKIIYYRIILDVKDTTTGDLTIKDVMPQGLSYKSGSLKAHFYYSDDNLQDENWNDHQYKFSSGKYKPKIKISDGEQGKTNMEITILDGYEKSGVQEQRIAIDYCAIVKDNDFWNNMKNSTKIYSNTAYLNSVWSTQKTTINRDVNVIGKSVKQLSDETGKKSTNVLAYNVPINPSGKDLNDSGDTLTLADQLTVPSGVSAYLDLNSVKIYSYDWSKDNKIGTEIDHSLYSFTFDEKTHKMTLEIPDEMGLVLAYNYNIDPGNISSPIISNRVDLGGLYHAHKDNSFKVESASASIGRRVLNINKVDAKDYSKFLPGAIFTISKRVGDDWQSKDYTTNEKGQINIDTLIPKALYKVEEKQAPDGYTINKNAYYVMAIGEDDNASLSDTYEQSLYDQLDQRTKELVGGKQNITFVGNQATTLLVADTPTNITIDKSWVDQNGKPTNPGAQNIHVNLYRTKKILPSVKVNFTIRHTDNAGWIQYKSLSIEKGTSIKVRVESEYDKGTILDAKGNDLGKSNTIGPFNEDTDFTIYTTSYGLAYDYKEPQLQPDYKSGIIAPGYQSGITLSSENNWSVKINDLPAMDDEGNDYVYYVKEDNVDGYSASYRNNGIGTGTIHVINTKDQTKTQLPSTGGNGAGLFYVLGCVLLMVSMMYVIIKKKVIK